jgi:hypothetical protein
LFDLYFSRLVFQVVNSCNVTQNAALTTRIDIDPRTRQPTGAVVDVNPAAVGAPIVLHDVPEPEPPPVLPPLPPYQSTAAVRRPESSPSSVENVPPPDVDRPQQDHASSKGGVPNTSAAVGGQGRLGTQQGSVGGGVGLQERPAAQFIQNNLQLNNVSSRICLFNDNRSFLE